MNQFLNQALNLGTLTWSIGKVMTSKKIQIIGAGSWGTAIAIALSVKHKIVMCSNNLVDIDEINLNHKSSKFPLIKLSNNISATSKISGEFDYTIIVVPSNRLETVIADNLESFQSLKYLIVASKGMNHIVPELFSSFFDRFNIIPLFLGGPNFAIEVASNKPASANLACKNFELAKEVAKDLACENLDFVPTDDYISAQISACYKNILAIYCGYIIQKGYGENYRAKICVDALLELKGICRHFGSANPTLISYFGIGDIMLSCFSEQSRNFLFGKKIALGEKLDSSLQVEGIVAANSLHKLCQNNGYSTPILEKVYKLLNGTTSS